MKPFNFSIAKALVSVYPSIGLEETKFTLRRQENETLSPHKRGTFSALRSPLSALRSPLSALRSPLSALRSPLSALRSPLSALRSPLSTLPYLFSAPLSVLLSLFSALRSLFSTLCTSLSARVLRAVCVRSVTTYVINFS
jgi:hypothetical protein